MGMVRIGIRPDRLLMFGDRSGLSMYVFVPALVILEINFAYHCISTCALQQTSKRSQVGQRRAYYPGRFYYCTRYTFYQIRKLWNSSNGMQSGQHVPNICCSSVCFLCRWVDILLILLGLNSAVQIFSQLLIWSLTLYKYVDLKHRSEWRAIPLLSVVVRDGFWVFASFSSKCFVKYQGTRLIASLISCSTARSGYCGGNATRVFPTRESAYSCPISVGFQFFIARVSGVIDHKQDIYHHDFDFGE